MKDTIDFIDILVLSEINITEDEISFFCLTDFNSFYTCRPNGRGGGILVFVRKHIQTIEISSNFVFTSTEFLVINVLHNEESIVLSAFYRPPNQNVNNFNVELETFLASNIVKKAKHFIMLGDINICYLTNMYGAEEYLNTLYTNGILNTIRTPTRIEFYGDNLVASCLDHINLKTTSKQFTSFVLEDKLADHFWTGLNLILRSNNNKQPILNPNKTYQFICNRKVDELIKNENWAHILELKAPEQIYTAITNKFENIYKEATKEISNKRKTEFIPWMNNELLGLIDHKNYLWNQWKRDKYNLHYMRLFKQARNNVTKQLRIAKKNFYTKQLMDNMKNTKKSWETVNQFLNKQKRPTILQSLKDNFKVENDTEIKAISNQFKDHFRDSIEEINAEMIGEPFNLNECRGPGNYEIGKYISMYFHTINENSLTQAVNKINGSSAAGPDKVRPQDIKKNLKTIGPILIHLYRIIIETGMIPINMKLTHLRPIYKSGNKQGINSYRPIGSISVLMKILEHHINDQLKNYVVLNQIIHEAQFGFMPKRSTIDLLELMTNDINTALNSNKFVLAVATDLSKAFDLVNYNKLEKKLENSGIRGPLLKLFKNYFKDRKIRVNIGEYLSNEYDQKYGLIQGSILSPLLFNIYVNDLPSMKFNSKVLQYADDNIFYVIHTDLNLALRLMQEDLNLMTKYFFNSSIKLNTQKTKAILFKNLRVKYNQDIHLNLTCHSFKCFQATNNCQCQNLTFYQTIKHLGIFFDSNMRFYSHLSYLKNLLKMVLYKCSKLTFFFPIVTKRIIYFSLVQSMFYYGINIYYIAPQYFLSPLTNILNRIMKVLFFNLPIDLLGIMQFEALAKYTDIVRNCYKEEFRIHEEVDYNLRRRQYIVNRHNNRYGINTLECRIPTLLNSLPVELQTETNLNTLKIRLKAFFIQFGITQRH